MIYEKNSVSKAMNIIRAACFNAYNFKSDDEVVNFTVDALMEIIKDQK